ncbi:hypothetical protein AU476_31260 [Cupriavidus sp. UYMSc13B]|nr:hypothetical protein AU476_31260 [Cupriavidus sp. UYMSc13B]
MLQQRVQQRDALSRHVAQQPRDTGIPQHAKPRSGVVEAGVRLFHDSTERGEPTNGRIAQGADFRIDRQVAQRAAVGHAHAGDAFIETLAQSRASCGKACQSRLSGPLITVNSSAASVTDRAIGPMWNSVPEWAGG